MPTEPVPGTTDLPTETSAPVPSFDPAPSAPEFTPPVQPTETAPTDLSQLADQTQTYTAPVSQPETLVVPPTSPEPTTIQTDGGGHHMPKWLLFVGIGLVLAVAGASAYFILGVGQTPTESIPATQQEQTLITPPAASPITQQQPPAATSSAGFGGFNDGTSQATSAADLLRQRQQQSQ
jgi:hypothetical protein